MASEHSTVIPTQRRRRLVFTSAGDRANIAAWLSKDRTFDLWVTYYGNQGRRYEGLCEYYDVRKGSKFQNFNDAYTHFRPVFDQYDAIWIADDDIVIDPSGIARLFDLQERYDLWVLQPAFSLRGRISHGETIALPWYLLHYTNFIEVTCPLFRHDKLAEFMAHYDSSLVGWGVDYLFISVLGKHHATRFAVIDSVPCINPHTHSKPGRVREMDHLKSDNERNAYAYVARKAGFEPYFEKVVFGGIPKPLWRCCHPSLLRFISAATARFLQWPVVLVPFLAGFVDRGLQAGLRHLAHRGQARQAQHHQIH